MTQFFANVSRAHIGRSKGGRTVGSRNHPISFSACGNKFLHQYFGGLFLLSEGLKEARQTPSIQRLIAELLSAAARDKNPFALKCRSIKYNEKWGKVGKVLVEVHCTRRRHFNNLPAVVRLMATPPEAMACLKDWANTV